MTTNSIIVTHNARLRCLITKLFNKSTIHADVIQRQKFKDYRWQNCCVLKLLLAKLDKLDKLDTDRFNFELSLIYDGEIDPTENKPGYQYWGNQSGNGEQIQVGPKKGFFSMFKKSKTPIEVVRHRFNPFEKLTGVISLNELRDVSGAVNSATNNDMDYIFYLVRHGQAEHNLYTKSNIIRKTDTSLTQNGIRGALYSGYAINDDLELNQSLLKYYFTSDLIRTRQTLESILSGIQSKYLTLDTRAKIIQVVILPCSHELAFVSNGKCDSKVNMGQLFTNENKMSCVQLNNYSSSTPEFKKCVSFQVQSADHVNIIVKIDWTPYAKFYGNSYRGTRSRKRKHCRQTSMIEEGIDYILNDGKQAVGGRKTRNRRKTRKIRNKK